MPEWLAFKTSVATAYAWAVPSAEAIATIARNARRVIEIGSGSGYWAWMLAAAGVDIIAFDVTPPTVAWYPVYVGDARIAGSFPDRALLLCWPPWRSSMAVDALDAYAGDTVIFIGEWMGGCADERFFAQLATQFQLVDGTCIPQWFARDDRLWIFRRACQSRSRRSAQVMPRLSEALAPRLPARA